MARKENNCEAELHGPAHFILLNEADNVLVCISPVKAGQFMSLNGFTIRIASDVHVGHKIARNDLICGDKVYRYGASIGSTTNAIARGEHVHLHNMQSDYIPVHTRESGRLKP